VTADQTSDRTSAGPRTVPPLRRAVTGSPSPGAGRRELGRRELGRWGVSLVATAASTYALDAAAASAGLLLATSGPLGGPGHSAVLAALVLSYVFWGLALRANLRANWALLEATGTSTNVLSKAGYALVRRRSSSPHAARLAAAVGYAGTELAKEVPYYAGAFGAVVLTDSVTAGDALVFLAGANLGAALYEYGLARLTGAFLGVRWGRRRRRHASFETDWVPAEYLAGYYGRVEADELATIGFFVDAMRRVEPGRAVLFFGVGPTLHHVFAAAEVASEIHLGDLLPANLDEIRRWLERRPRAHDWRPFVRYTLQCEGIRRPTDADVAAREDLTRRRITRLVQVDARDPRPVDRQYATVVSAYCADSATDDRGTWELFMRNITGLVRPGGLFVTAALRHCRSYAVAGKSFPSADVDEDDLRSVLQPAFALPEPGPDGKAQLDGFVEVRQVGQDVAHGYGSIVLGWARRAGGRYQQRVAAPALVGAGTRVPVVGGGERRFVNLDYAASAPCLVAVRHAVEELLPWYSSVHRGAGYTSELSTDAYEGAREAVKEFVNGRDDDVLVFTRNTTDAVNLLASALPQDTEVFAFAAEHHANLLPWRRGQLTLLPVPTSAADAVGLLEAALSSRSPGRPRLVSVTGASNVTGEIWPYPDLALSGHKLYAPFGAGALVGARDWLRGREPHLAGGGAVRYVGTDTVLWADLPDRQEAGSPNVVGAVALGVACRTLQVADRESLEADQNRLVDRARDRLTAIPGVQVYRLWDAGHPRIGVLPFALDGVPYVRLGIDARHEAAIRDGLARGVPTAVPGAVRASAGLGTTAADLDRLVDAVTDIAAHGPRWTYTSTADGTDCRPTPDPRRRPSLSFDLATASSLAPPS